MWAYLAYRFVEWLGEPRWENPAMCDAWPFVPRLTSREVLVCLAHPLFGRHRHHNVAPVNRDGRLLK